MFRGRRPVGDRAHVIVLLAPCMMLWMSCSKLTDPVETQRSVTLSYDIRCSGTDSLRMDAIDTVNAALLSAAFNDVKDRITRVACSPPTITVAEYSGSDSAIVDTLFVYVGTASASPTDTLSGPTFLTRDQLADSVPQVMWVNSPVLWNVSRLLGSDPYAFALRLYVHSTKRISRFALHMDFPLTVSYLN